MCTLFLFWESQCGGELGQLLYMYIHICDSHQILNQKPNWYGMGTCIAVAYGYGAKP